MLDADQKKLAKKALHVREDAGGGVYVDGLTEHIVKSPSEIMDLLHLGSTMRTTGAAGPRPGYRLSY